MSRKEMDEQTYEEFRKIRSAYLGQLTRFYKDIEKKMISRDNAEDVNALFKKLCDRYEQFKTAHLECLDLCSNSDIKETLELNFDSTEKNFIEFNERYNEWIGEPEEEEKKDDKRSRRDSDSTHSRISSVSHTSLSTQYRLKVARANRLKAEFQVKKMAEKHELERARRELEMQEQMLESKSKLEEARLEEFVWQNVDEDDSEVAFKVHRDDNMNFAGNALKSNEENERAIHEPVTTKSTSRIEGPDGSLQSSSSIDTAFQKLASTLQEGFNLPKPELLTFQGKPTDYCKFIKNFEANVESKVKDDQLRLSYLIQYCKGEAKSSVEDCVLLEPKEGYKRARSILYSRYGRSHMIVRSYIDNLVHGAQIKVSDFESLSKLALEMQKCEITLSQLGYVSDIDNTDNLRKIVKRLPMHMRVKWVDVAHSITETGREPRFSDLAKFIDQKSRLATSMYGLDLVKESSNRKNVDSHFDTKTKEKVSTFVSNSTHASKSNTHDSKCICCDGKCKYLDTCLKFKSMHLTDRVKFVKNAKLCFNCLKGRHFAKVCRKDKTCTVETCSSKHHILLHDWVTNNDRTATSVSVNCSSTVTAIKNCLGIIPVVVRGTNGNTCETYALVDDGADKTLCDERLLQKLGTESRPVMFQMTTATSQKVQQEGREVDLQIRSVSSDSLIDIRKVWSVKHLPVSSRSAANNKDLSKYAHLSDIYIPEIESSNVLLLIGTDAPEAHVPIDVRSGNSQDPYAIKTRLGWIVRGPINNESKDDAININFGQSSNDMLQQQLERLWTTDFQDKAVMEKTCMSVEDRRAMEKMESSVTFEDGHYKLGLPWREDNAKLPNNLPLAHARLQQLHRKLSHDPELHKMYTTSVNDYIQKGYAKEVTDVDNESSRIWYLPHHPVTNANKPGKVRVVFDCAAKYKDISLNSQLLQGPDLLNSLVGVLIRFRQEDVALSADIEAMFHQVRVQNDDCDALRFLWWPNGDLKAQPKHYKMQVHLFGATSSPSCAAYAFKKTAVDNGDLFEPEVATTVERNFYVDDLLKSVKTEDEAIKLATDLQTLTKLGGFRLTKWMSNSKVVLNEIQESERAPSVANLDHNAALPTDRALGVTWDVNDDKFKFRVKLNEQPMTRRGIVSTLSSIFDPLGLISPIVFRGKLLLQTICRQSTLGWDDTIAPDKQEEWTRWKTSLPELENISVPRCFKLKGTSIANAQLHVFTDGSESGYGACAYLRIVDTAGNINCSLVLGKSRLAPLKQTTIPRLELSGAVVACKMYEMIKEELDIELESVTFWTDSMIVLGYIKNTSRRFKTFVANRLSIIHETTSVDQWRYVDTKSNPADIASRGLNVADQKRITMYLNGPDFLWTDTVKWQNQPSIPSIDQQDREIKKEVSINSATVEMASLKNVIDYFSDWYRLKRAVAWLIRFKSYCKHRFLQTDDQVVKGDLTINELHEAEMTILRYTQHEMFSSEFDELTRSKHVKKSSRMADLNPVLHDELIRVKGRLDLPIESCPIILPNSHHVTTLIIRSYHENNGHIGMSQVLASLRETYWILNGPSSVKRVLKQCIRCRRYQAPFCNQKMAPILTEQKTADKPPFSFVGIDYFGPFSVKIGSSVEKRYGCIFTCLTTRAVHLEVAHSMTSNSFIAAFQRFTSRRGFPEKA